MAQSAVTEPSLDDDTFSLCRRLVGWLGPGFEPELDGLFRGGLLTATALSVVGCFLHVADFPKPRNFAFAGFRWLYRARSGVY